MHRLDDRSRMSGDVHVRFSESLRGRFPRATRPVCHCTNRAQAEQLPLYESRDSRTVLGEAEVPLVCLPYQAVLPQRESL